ncbi:MAG: hypothetical protein AAF696_22815 [Bacteroidota bacterium]
MKISSAWYYLLLPFFLLNACIVDENELRDRYENGNEEVELAENTVILPEDNKSGLLSVGRNTLEFDASSRWAKDFEIGDILAVGITEKAPRGFLRKIRSMRESGNRIIIDTEQAKLSEALLKAEVRFEKELDEDDFLGKARGIRAELELSDNSPLSGSVEIKPRILFEMSSNGLSLDRLKMGMGFTHSLTAQLALAGGRTIELEKELLERDLKPILIFIGGIFPLVITPEFELSAGLEYNGPELSFGYTISGTTDMYVQKENGNWSFKKDVRDNASLTGPSLEISTGIEVYVKPALEFEFYDSDAVELGVFLKKSVIGEATIEVGEGIGCELSCSASFGAEVEIDILGFEANPTIEIEPIQFAPFYSCDPEELSDDILDIISEDVFEEFIELDMPLNGGLTPPNIEGTFRVTPFILKSSNIPSDNIGLQFVDYDYTFYDQDMENNTIKISTVSSNGAVSEGVGSYIAGNGNSFSIFTELNGSFQSGSRFIHAEVISGEITSEGIVNFHKAILMLEDNGDPSGDLIEVGQGRACFDSDAISPRQ